MYKQTYKIPSSLDRSILDHEISLSDKTQMRMIPLKVVLFWLCSMLLVVWLVMSTPVKQADPVHIISLIVWWVLATAFFGQYSKTKELKISQLSVLADYLPRSSRRVYTRRTNNASGFYSVSGIKDLDPDGRVTFAEGTVGRGYSVVGSASVLVFEEDKEAIIERVDAFYRKVDTTVELAWITTKEPQKVYRQLANLERRNLALEVRDPELFALLDEQASILTDYVGNSFSSIHQYLVAKADNDEALQRAHGLIQAEVEESSLMIKGCSMLDEAGFAELARALYTYDG